MLPANKQNKMLLEIVRLDVVKTFTANNNNVNLVPKFDCHYSSIFVLQAYISNLFNCSYQKIANFFQKCIFDAKIQLPSGKRPFCRNCITNVI